MALGKMAIAYISLNYAYNIPLFFKILWIYNIEHVKYSKWR